MSHLFSIFLDNVSPLSLLLFKMKNENFCTKNFQQIGLRTKASNPLIKGITKALLEKYKSKHLHDLEAKINRKDQKILA